MTAVKITRGDVVQLSPTTVNPSFAGCFMVVTKPTNWGAKGFVTIPGQGLAYYRATLEEMHYVGTAQFIKEDE